MGELVGELLGGGNAWLLLLQQSHSISIQIAPQFLSNFAAALLEQSRSISIQIALQLLPNFAADLL
ncbi:hypothetical protein TIFTF001_055754 [Ficus carica]|uniref:Uncharacterized protein n=1 Tax=Ficus carica TaxID=3494 RepID=A0AA88EFH4_FICCA|nr:hypothetical protein TIFTF001_055754 [Ficus carica]